MKFNRRYYDACDYKSSHIEGKPYLYGMNARGKTNKAIANASVAVMPISMFKGIDTIWYRPEAVAFTSLFMNLGHKNNETVVQRY